MFSNSASHASKRQDEDQIRFRDVLLCLRNVTLIIADWQYVMTHTLTNVHDKSSFDNALHLYPTVEAAVQHNANQLQ